MIVAYINVPLLPVLTWRGKLDYFCNIHDKYKEYELFCKIVCTYFDLVVP